MGGVQGNCVTGTPSTRIVKSAAENIYPAEVEGCIKQHAAVADCAIIGVPDPKWTQNVKAIVVLKKGESANEEDIVAHCRERIASYKKPKSVEFVDGPIAGPPGDDQVRTAEILADEGMEKGLARTGVAHFNGIARLDHRAGNEIVVDHGLDRLGPGLGGNVTFL